MRFIFLPHDVLSEIFSIVSSSYNWLHPSADRHAVLSRMVLVSKDWNAAGTPILYLYRELALVWSEQRAEHLLRTFIQNPSLAAFPLRLSIVMQIDSRPLVDQECTRLLSTPWGEERKKEERKRLCYLPEEEKEEILEELEERARARTDEWGYTDDSEVQQANRIKEELNSAPYESSRLTSNSWSFSSFSMLFPESDMVWPDGEDYEGEEGPDSEQARLHAEAYEEKLDLMWEQREADKEAFEQAKLARRDARRAVKVEKQVEEVVEMDIYRLLSPETGFGQVWVDECEGAHALFRLLAKLSSLRDFAVEDLGATYEIALERISAFDHTESQEVSQYQPPEVPIERAPAEDGVGWHNDLERVLGNIRTFVSYDTDALSDLLKRMTNLESLTAKG
ncbi:hypothetical protein RQP46_005749 [Phenoliferia psychrophenolica]